MSQDFSNMTPEDLEALAAEMRNSAGGTAVVDPAPVVVPAQPSAPQDPYAPTVWGSNEYDFRVPSGQLCRMKKLRPEELVGSDLLDRITRLPGFADEEVRKAEGQPPTPEKLPSKEELDQVLEVLDELIPIVVVKPVVHPTPKADASGEVKGKEPGFVYVDDIELLDRIAIMERAVQGVKKMDNFRQEP